MSSRYYIPSLTKLSNSPFPLFIFSMAITSVNSGVSMSMRESFLQTEYRLFGTVIFDLVEGDCCCCFCWIFKQKWYSAPFHFPTIDLPVNFPLSVCNRRMPKSSCWRQAGSAVAQVWADLLLPCPFLRLLPFGFSASGSVILMAGGIEESTNWSNNSRGGGIFLDALFGGGVDGNEVDGLFDHPMDGRNIPSAAD